MRQDKGAAAATVRAAWHAVDHEQAVAEGWARDVEQFRAADRSGDVGYWTRRAAELRELADGLRAVADALAEEARAEAEDDEARAEWMRAQLETWGRFRGLDDGGYRRVCATCFAAHDAGSQCPMALAERAAVEDEAF